jgi:ABC-2 type transport system ATP-binding protein
LPLKYAICLGNWYYRRRIGREILDTHLCIIAPNDVAALPHRRTSKIDKENNTTIISGRDLGHVTAERVALLEGGQVVRDEPVTEATLGELRDYFAREVHL